jgi:uncharacterized protein YggE
LIAAVVASLAIVVACGGDDDDGGDESASEITTNKGLLVAAQINDLGLTATEDDAAIQTTSDDGDAAPEFAGAASGTGADRKAGDVFSGPLQQAGSSGITVSGYGSATATADSAVIEFYYNRSGGIEPVPLPEPVPPTDSDGGGSSSSGSSGADDGAAVAQNEVAEITEADLQPVIDALVAAGIPRENIEFVPQGYKDPYYASATLRVTVDDITAVDVAIAAADGAAANLGDIYSGGNYVTYTVSDCAAMERAAMEAAVEDAGERGAVFAEVLGVGLGSVTGASQYSYSAFGDGSCGGYGGPIYYDTVASSGSGEVEVYASVTITYAIN